MAAITLLLQMGYLYELMALVTVVPWEIRSHLVGSDLADPRLIAGIISGQLVMVLIWAVPGIIGATLSALLIRKVRYRARWYLAATRFFAYTWLAFVPLGTILGYVLLRWSRDNEPSNPGNQQE